MSQRGEIVDQLEALRASQVILQNISGEPPVGPITVGDESTPLLSAVPPGKARIAVAVANTGAQAVAFVWGMDATFTSPLQLEPGERIMLTPSSQASLAAITENPATTTVTLIEFLTETEV